jgi:serine/threonine protein kinase
LVTRGSVREAIAWASNPEPGSDRARESTLGRDVAIKVLPSLFTRDPERLLRFEREAGVLATLNHHNIGAIYGVVDPVPDAGRTATRALVLQLIDGETLAERMP